MNGVWRQGPGRALFDALHEQLGQVRACGVPAGVSVWEEGVVWAGGWVGGRREFCVCVCVCVATWPPLPSFPKHTPAAHHHLAVVCLSPACCGTLLPPVAAAVACPFRCRSWQKTWE
jgi:hypothetical protein